MKARGEAAVAVDSATMVVSTQAADALAFEVSASSAYWPYASNHTVATTATIAIETMSSQSVNHRTPNRVRKDAGLVLRLHVAILFIW